MNKLLIGTADKTNLLLQFLAEQFTTGVTIVDPTGDLAELAANSLPPNLTQRALYFDPADSRYPVGLNVLANVPEGSQPQLIQLLSDWLDLLMPGGDSTLTRLYAKPFLVASLRLLLGQEKATLLHLMAILRDRAYRETLLTKCTDPLVQETCAAMDDKQYQNAVAFLLSNFRMLFMNPIVRNIIGQPTTTFRGADIIIANLDRAKLGDDTVKLLGGLLIAQSTGHVVINDYGFFSAPLPLPQQRFTLSLNFLDELPQKLKHQVLGIEDKYVLKTGKNDAEELAFHLGLLNPRQLMDQAAGEAVGAFVGRLKFGQPEQGSRLEPLRRRTRACHTRPILKVEAIIRQYL